VKKAVELNKWMHQRQIQANQWGWKVRVTWWSIRKPDDAISI
jgi:hypothetical protein